MKIKLFAALGSLFLILAVLPSIQTDAKVKLTKNEWSWSVPTNNTSESVTGNGPINNAYQKGSENPRSHYYLYDTEEKARENFTLYPLGKEDDPHADPTSKWYLNLNGKWKFKYDVNPGVRVWPTGEDGAFEADETGFDTTEWDDLSVPSNWQVNWNEDGSFKYDNIAYTNYGYPWPNWNGNAAHARNTNPPTEYNGVGTHQRTFEIPSDWDGKHIFLNFDGADNFYVWVDGTPVGWSEDPMTHHEWDITEALKAPIAGEHTVTVQIIRWSVGSFFEDQDFLRMSGIFRNIYLMARNTEDLWDLQVDTAPVSTSNMDGDWKFNLKTAVRDYSDALKFSGTSKDVYYKLYDADGNVVASDSDSAEYEELVTNLTQANYNGTFGGGVRWSATAEDHTAADVTSTSISVAKPSFTATVPAQDVHLWSSEDPYLYKLVVYVDNGLEDTEYACIRVGFRYVEYTAANNSNSRLLVNGKRVTFYGTNVHEVNPDTGRVMTMDMLLKDVNTMKQNNVNAMRMSHYPHDTRLYDLADEYGLYIMDEANIEAHATRQSDHGSQTWAMTNAPRYGPLQRDRNLNMFERDKNFASVVSWSVGNENPNANAVFSDYTIRVLEKRERDVTGRGTVGTGTATTNNSGRPSHCEFGNNYAQLHSSMYPSISSWSASPSSTKPVVLCEYVHAMGNSSGGWDSWIRIMEGRNNDIGGFIWDWVDQSVKTPVPKPIETSAFAKNAVTDEDAAAVGNSPQIYTGTGEESGPESYAAGQKYMKGYVTFPHENINTAADFTYDVDVYPTSKGSDQYIIGIGDHRWALKQLGQGLQVWCRNASGSWLDSGSSGIGSSQYTVNNWHRMTVSVSNGVATLYVDGNSVGTCTNSGNSLYAADGLFSLGMNDAKNGELFSGYIGNARVVNKALTAAEITAQGNRVPAAAVEGQTETFRLSLGSLEYGDPGPNTDYFAYGGDWDDPNNNNDFCANGMLLPDRTPKPQVDEMKRQYQLLVSRLKGTPTADSVAYTVRNKFMYTNADAFDMTWQITENGTVIRSGSDVLDVEPLPAGTTGNKYSEADFQLAFEKITPKPNAEYHFNIQFRLRSDSVWAKAGHVVAENQLALESDAYTNEDKPYAPVKISKMTVTGDTAENNSGEITIAGPDDSFLYVFDKAAGQFSSMKYGEKEFITSGPEPNFYRAPTDNEMNPGNRGQITPWENVGSERTRGNTTYTVATYPNYITLEAAYSNATAGKILSTGSKTLYTIYPDGEVNVDQTYVFGTTTGWCAELGSVMTVAPEFENLTYFGRGKAENYVDRKWGSDAKIWNTTVTDNYTEYVKSQTTGNHIDTRWLALTDDEGFGILVKSGEFAANSGFSGSAPSYNPAETAYNAESLLEFNALHFTQSELSATGNYHPYELFRDTRSNQAGGPIYLSVNVAGRGVGGDDAWSGNAQPHAPYRLEVSGKTFQYNYSIKPVDNFNAAKAAAYSREIHNPYQNVKDLMPLAVAAGVNTGSSAYRAAENLTASSGDLAAMNVYNNLFSTMSAQKPILNSVSAAGVTAAPNADNEVRIAVPYGTDLESIQPAFETSSDDTIVTPEEPQDFSDGPVEYTLTDGTKNNKYTVSIETTECERAITAFRLLGTDGVIIDDPAADEGIISVDLTGKGDIDLSAVVPDAITIVGEKIAPGMLKAQDFSAPVRYTVTASDGAQRNYNVIVLDDSAAFIKSFKIGQAEGIINNLEDTIEVLLPYGSVLTGITPDVEINGTSYTPTGSLDFTAPQTFTVINGTNQRSYTVTVTVDPGTACDITSFTVNGYTGVIDGTDITLTVPYETNLDDLKNVTPAIVTSIGATYTPAGAVNLVPGTPVVYTVTSANTSNTASYNVNVEVAPPVLTSVDPSQSLVFATTDVDGARGLPDKITCLSQGGETFEADVTWGNAAYTLYSTINVTGRASYMGSNTLTFTAKVEVVKPDTRYFINSGTAASGSDLYDAVKEYMGSGLKNQVSDQATTAAAAGVWGSYGSSNQSWTLYTESSYTMAKYDTGFYGSNNATSRTTYYRIPLDAGIYNIGIGMKEWWNGPRSTRLVLTYNDGSAKSVTLADSVTPTSSGTQVTGSFELADAADVTLEFTTLNAQAQVVSWIQVSQVSQDELTEVVTDDHHFALYEQDVNKDNIIARLPGTMKAKTISDTVIDCDVVWETENIPDSGEAYETIIVNGVLTSPGGKTITTAAEIEVVPKGLLYFIDANSMVAVNGRKDAGSRAYDSVSALAAPGTLLNDIADQEKGSEDWGYTTPVGTSGKTMRSGINENLEWYKVENYTDKFNYGWYSANTADAAPLSYDLKLPAGSHVITTGIQEFWPSANSHTRPYTVTVSQGDVVLDSVSATLYTAPDQYPGARQTDSLFITLEEEATVTVTMLKTAGQTGEEPQLSWLAAAKVDTKTVSFSVVNPDSDGSLTARVDGAEIVSGQKFIPGKEVVFTAVPEDGYRIKEWKLNGDVVKDEEGNTFTETEYRLENLTEDVDVTVEFELISIPVESVSLAPPELSMVQGTKRTLTHTISPSNATNQDVSWKTSSSSVATVDNGEVTAVAPGNATITVVTADGAKEASCEVTVTATAVPVTGVTLEPTALSLAEGQKDTLTHTITPANATNKEVTWKSSNSSVATVNNGEVTAVAPGNATITVVTEDGDKEASCEVAVTAAAVPVTDVTLEPTVLSLVEGQKEALTHTIIPANASNKDVTWESSNPSAATVDNGEVTAVAPGNATIKVVTADGGKEASCEVTVTAAAVPVTGVTLEPTELSLVEGQKEALTHTITPANASNKDVTWESSNSSVAAVDNGEVTTIAPGIATIKVVTVDGSKEAACEVTVTARQVETSYVVTLDPNGGKFTSAAEGLPRSIKMGDKIGTLPVPTYTGYTFKGWFTAKTGGVQVTDSYTVTANMTIYARWEKAVVVPKPPKAGTTFTAGNYKYKIVKAATAKKDGTVQVTGLKKKTLTKVTIPAKAKHNTFSYKVVSIKKNAFKGNKKIKKVTIGSNVTQIGAQAFTGCSKLTNVTIGKNVTKIGKKAFYNSKKLKKVTIKSKKLKTVAKNAFKKIHKKASIKVPKNQLKSYKRMLKKSGLDKLVKVKK